MVFLAGARGIRVDAGRVRKNLIFAHQRRARNLSNHEAAVEPRSLGEKRSEAAREGRIDQLLDPSLADVGELGERDGAEIEGEREGLAVEVTTRDEVRLGVRRIGGV